MVVPPVLDPNGIALMSPGSPPRRTLGNRRPAANYPNGVGQHVAAHEKSLAIPAVRVSNTLQSPGSPPCRNRSPKSIFTSSSPPRTGNHSLSTKLSAPNATPTSPEPASHAAHPP